MLYTEQSDAEGIETLDGPVKLLLLLPLTELVVIKPFSQYIRQSVD